MPIKILKDFKMANQYASRRGASKGSETLGANAAKEKRADTESAVVSALLRKFELAEDRISLLTRALHHSTGSEDLSNSEQSAKASLDAFDQCVLSAVRAERSTQLRNLDYLSTGISSLFESVARTTSNSLRSKVSNATSQLSEKRLADDHALRVARKRPRVHLYSEIDSLSEAIESLSRSRDRLLRICELRRRQMETIRNSFAKFT
jgi:hypothetical protein